MKIQQAKVILELAESREHVIPLELLDAAAAALQTAVWRSEHKLDRAKELAVRIQHQRTRAS